MIESGGGFETWPFLGALTMGAGGRTWGSSSLKPILQALHQGAGGTRCGPSPRSPHSVDRDSDTGSGSWGSQRFERTLMGLWGEGKEGEGQGAAHTGGGLSWVIGGG